MVHGPATLKFVTFMTLFKMRFIIVVWEWIDSL